MTHAVRRFSKNCIVPNTANVIRVGSNIPESASGVLPLDKLESPIVRQGLDYWQKLRGQRPYPSRAEMTPRDLTNILRHVVLLRVIEGGADYEYRIVGDAHVISHGFSMQGLRVSDVDKFSPGYGPVLKSLYDHTLRRRDAYAFRGWMERGERQKQYIYSESIFMPLGPDEKIIDHVLNFSVYVPRDSFDG
jgi:hypothetical protein